MVRIFAVFALTLGVTHAVKAQPILNQNFDANPGWTLLGNGINNTDFGYRSTSLAGGNPGEAGGRFTRSHFDQIYADRQLGGSLNLDLPLSGSGRMVVANSLDADLGYGLVIGHFDPVTHASIGLM